MDGSAVADPDNRSPVLWERLAEALRTDTDDIWAPDVRELTISLFQKLAADGDEGARRLLSELPPP